MAQPPGPGAYDVQDGAALAVVAVTGMEADQLDRAAARLADAVDATAAATGAGSAVTAALAEVRARGEDVARANRALVDRASGAARVALGAYVGADSDMAGQYGPRLPFDPFPHRPPVADPLDPFGLVPPR